MPRVTLRTATALGSALVVATLLTACSSNSSSSTTTTTASSTSTTAANASRSLTTAQVTTLQGNLVKVGCYNGAVDGIFGPGTDASLRSFQKASGITVDGVYGTTTAAKLTASSASGTKVCVATSTSTTTSTTSASAATPPCTAGALQAALPAGGTDAIATTTSGGLQPFGCSGNYAYAFVNHTPPAGSSTNPAETGWDYTQLFAAQNGAWAVVDRATYCPMVPPTIYTPGCTTN